MPSRRRFVRTSATTLSGATVIGLSGCLGSMGFGGGPPEVREESGDPPARMSPAISDLHADSTHATLVVGEGGTRHEQVWVWNEIDGSREVAIAIGPGDDGDAEPWFRRRYDLAADANLAVDLRDARDYEITIGVGDRSETVEFPEDWFDCNDTITDVAVRPSEIASSRVSTQEKCDTGIL